MTPAQARQLLALEAAKVDAQLRGYPSGAPLPVEAQNAVDSILARMTATALILAETRNAQ